MASDIYYNDPKLKKSFDNLGSNADMAMSNWMTASQNYDPQASVNASATGAFNAFKRNLGQSIGDLRGEQVGMGRLDTGFATNDEDRLVSRGIADLNDKVLQNSMQAENLKFQNMTNIGNFAQNAGQDYRQGIADLNATRRQQQLMDKASKRSMWGSIATGLLGAAGTALAGPIGGALFAGAAKKATA